MFYQKSGQKIVKIFRLPFFTPNCEEGLSPGALADFAKADGSKADLSKCSVMMSCNTIPQRGDDDLVQ